MKDFTDEEVAYLVRLLVFNYADTQEHYSGNISESNKLSDSILSKCIYRSYSNRELWSELRKERRSSEERLDIKLFMGAGYHSTVQVNELHKRLAYAVYQLGGLQQSGGQGTDPDVDLDDKAERDIKFVLKDIIFAFGYTLEDLSK